MDRPVTDYASARNMMVDGQVRPNKVTDSRILNAMRSLKRETFVPAAMAARAYADEDVPLPNGRAMVEPMVIARLVQMLNVTRGVRVLVVGAGTGYGSALLDACGAQVTALEEDAALLALARAVLPGCAPGVAIVEGKLADGWHAGAPYDAVLIEGAVHDVPPSIAAQVRRPGGRIATVRVAGAARMGQAVLAEPVGGGTSTALSLRAVFDCATPILPSLARPPAFVF